MEATDTRTKLGPGDRSAAQPPIWTATMVITLISQAEQETISTGIYMAPPEQTALWLSGILIKTSRTPSSSSRSALKI